MDKYLMPFVRSFFVRKSDLSYSINDGYDTQSGKKPDIKIGFNDKHKTIDVVYFEVKRPNITSRHQEENDYVKLLKKLLVSLNYRVQETIPSPVTFGVLCEGFECSLVRMHLVEDGIYLATTVREFRFPRTTSSLSEIPTVIECFHFMLEELEKV